MGKIRRHARQWTLRRVGGPMINHEIGSVLREWETAKLVDSIDRHRERARFENKEPSPLPVTTGGLKIANLVLQGGGTLGIAHLGFIYALERFGYRFSGIAGTSAGSIIALLMVACRTSIGQPTAERIYSVLQAMPMDLFLDGPAPARRLIKRVVGAPAKLDAIEMFRPLIDVIGRVLKYRGINNGAKFYDWLSQTLSSYGVESFENLEHRLRASLPANFQLNGCDVKLRGMDLDQLWKRQLAIIATAIPVGSKFVLPRDMNLLSTRYAGRSPALMARMSMAVPLFFDPVHLELDSHSWSRYLSDGSFREYRTTEELRELGDLRRLSFIDGGLLSNLPIDAFESSELGHMTDEASTFVRNTPTIACSLRTNPSRRTTSRRNTVFGLLGDVFSVFDSVRGLRDAEAFERARRQRNGVRLAFIDTGEHNWLDFGLSSSAKKDLFARGLKSGTEFLLSTEDYE